MKYIFIILFLLIITILNSCKINNHPKRYIIYKGSEEYYFPNYKIEILLEDDSTAYFKNYILKDSIFVQKFNYNISDDVFLHIKNLDTINTNIISLKENDTIVVFKKKLYYPYIGNEMFYLFFKRSR